MTYHVITVSMNPTARALIASVIVISMTACSAILRNPVPEEIHLDTTVLGRSDLRFWGDSAKLDQGLILISGDSAALQAKFGGIMHTEHNYLAISGGGGRRLRCRPTGRLEYTGHPSAVHHGHRGQYRRADRTVRLPR